jgi:glycosyltransferase involved in cell wall biosynthesis
MTNICFLVGSVAISGGTYVIFQHASYLQSKGFNVTLAVQEPFSSDTYSWHPEASHLTLLNFDTAKAKTYDLVIATWWKTALELAEFSADKYSYFVQSIESRFYPEDEGPLRRLVEATYQLPVNYVTEVSWIQSHLLEQHGQTALVVRNGVRKDIYRPNAESSKKYSNQENLRVLVEGPFRVKFKNVGKTIKLLRKAGISDISLLTSSPVTWVPGVRKVYSRVPITAVPNIYQSCDVLVKLSTVEGMFGPPLEMFHCGGTAVVYNVSGYDEYIQNGVNALVAPMGQEDVVVSHVRRLMQDRALLSELKINAIKTAETWPSWNDSSFEFNAWVEKTLNQPSSDKQNIAEHVAMAWREYVRDEQIRLKNLPKSVLKSALNKFVRRLPPGVVRMIENTMAIYEVIR